MTEVSDIQTLFGDRVLVEKLERPQRIGSFYVPESHSRTTVSRRAIWWGVVRKFGLDSRASDPNGDNLAVGDIVGVEPLGADCEVITDRAGVQYHWVADEFIAAKDDGTIRRQYARD